MKLKSTHPTAARTLEEFNDFEASIAERSSATLKKWSDELLTWEADSSMPNPFVRRAAIHSVANVRLSLAKEELAELTSGQMAIHEEVSPSVWLTAGLELEEQQYISH